MAVEIPLPSLSEQQRLITLLDRISMAISKAQLLRQEIIDKIETLYDSITSEVFTKVSFKYGTVKISQADLLLNAQRGNPSKLFSGEQFTYVDISSVPRGPSTVTSGKRIPSTTAPSRARRIIHKDDIIISTVRPYLRSFAKVGAQLDKQICSTGFAVFSCGRSIIPDYLLFQLCSPFFLNQCVTRGGHYPALNGTSLKKINIVCPPINEQVATCQYLERLHKELDMLKELHQTSHSLMNALLRSTIHNVIRNKFASLISCES